MEAGLNIYLENKEDTQYLDDRVIRKFIDTYPETLRSIKIHRHGNDYTQDTRTYIGYPENGVWLGYIKISLEQVRERILYSRDLVIHPLD